MRKRALIVSLLLLILSLGRSEGAPTPPSDDQIDRVYAQNPAAIREMVRKLFVIENSEAQITVPGLQVTVALDGSSKVQALADLDVLIGSGKYTVSYSIRPTFTDVRTAVTQKPEPPWGILIGGWAGTLVFAGAVGFSIGLLTAGR